MLCLLRHGTLVLYCVSCLLTSRMTSHRHLQFNLSLWDWNCSDLDMFSISTADLYLLFRRTQMQPVCFWNMRQAMLSYKAISVNLVLIETRIDRTDSPTPEYSSVSGGFPGAILAPGYGWLFRCWFWWVERRWTSSRCSKILFATQVGPGALSYTTVIWRSTFKSIQGIWSLWFSALEATRFCRKWRWALLLLQLGPYPSYHRSPPLKVIPSIFKKLSIYAVL